MGLISSVGKALWKKWSRKYRYFVTCRGDKVRYLRMAGVRIGEGCDLLNAVECYEAEPWLIEIGNRVTVTSGVGFVTHDGSSRLFRGQLPGSSPWGNRFAPIIIRDNCFIGVDSTLMPGVTIGPNSIVGVRSLVTKDVPPGTVVAGIPARVVCTLEEYIEKYKQKMLPIEAKNREELRKELTRRFWGEER